MTFHFDIGIHSDMKFGAPGQSFIKTQQRNLKLKNINQGVSLKGLTAVV